MDDNVNPDLLDIKKHMLAAARKLRFCEINKIVYRNSLIVSENSNLNGYSRK